VYKAMPLDQWNRQQHPRGANGDLHRHQLREAIVLRGAAQHDNLEGKGDGTAEREQVSAIQRSSCGG
jgi:hypothetical protein